MKTSKLGIGIASTALALSLLVVPTADAFFGGHDSENGNRPEMTQEHFDEMKQLFLSGDFESFKTAMETRRAERQAEHETMQNSVTRSIENISNGVIKTISSTDAAVVSKIQEHKSRFSENDDRPQHENANREIELAANGVQITITSDDAAEVSKIQERAAQWESGEKMNRGKKGMNGGEKTGRDGRGKNFQNRGMRDSVAE
ncbi:hypothetical protein HN954_00685 [bacterium]|jgi:hypothetical protein|nr:hypothetical protein [bacterium]MBT6832385.1 hypothetical protein [bacterium]MBT6995930.1 hypothetical protein [bacterium]MBT7772791.1 hypothetical protein [bacterium]